MGVQIADVVCDSDPGIPLEKLCVTGLRPCDLWIQAKDQGDVNSVMACDGGTVW